MTQADQFEAIRARHANVNWPPALSPAEAQNAHADRATLITLLQTERAARLKAESELAGLREAAGWATVYKDHFPWASDDYLMYVRMCDFRRLAAALQEKPHES
jgi:hypothetical protein